MTDTRTTTIVFETNEEYSADQLHEDLCLAIHESDLDALYRLDKNVSDIKAAEPFGG